LIRDFCQHGKFIVLYFPLFILRSDVGKIYEDCRELEETGRKVLVLDFREKDQAKLEKNKESVRKFVADPEVSYSCGGFMT
jgi:hypothetical protein